MHETPGHAARCNNAISKVYYGYGHRLCSECRPSVEQILDRADQQTAELVGQIEDMHLQFDPPVDIRVSNARYRETQVNCGLPVCRCSCESCAVNGHAPRGAEAIEAREMALLNTHKRWRDKTWLPCSSHRHYQRCFANPDPDPNPNPNPLALTLTLTL